MSLGASLQCSAVHTLLASSPDRVAYGVSCAQRGLWVACVSAPYYRIRFAFMDGTFEPAPDFMVIRESKSSVLSSKSKDRIVPIHRGLTDQHVNLVMGVVMPRLASFLLAEQKAICADGACGSTGYETMPLGF